MISGEDVSGPMRAELGRNGVKSPESHEDKVISDSVFADAQATLTAEIARHALRENVSDEIRNNRQSRSCASSLVRLQ